MSWLEDKWPARCGSFACHNKCRIDANVNGYRIQENVGGISSRSQEMNARFRELDILSTLKGRSEGS